MVNLDNPHQQGTLEIEGWLRLADSKSTDDLENRFLGHLADRIQILDDAVEAGLVQIGA